MVATGHLRLTEVQHDNPWNQENGSAAIDDQSESVDIAVLDVVQINRYRRQRISKAGHRATRHGCGPRPTR